MWDISDGRLISHLQGPRAAVSAVRFDDERLVCCGHDSSVALFDFASVDFPCIQKVRALLGRQW